jgi:integrase/recombinase XerD
VTDLIDKHVVWMRAGNFSAHTIKSRVRLLRLVDDQITGGLASATHDDLAAFLTADGGWANWTRKTYYTHIKAFYRWAIRTKVIAVDPTADLPRPRQPDDAPNPVSEAQLQFALERSNDTCRLIITLAAYAGLRAGDICALRREDVTAERITIRHGKGDKSASIPTHPKIWALVEALPPGLLVPGRNGVQRNSGTLASWLRVYFDSIGMPDVHLHRFRHYFATTLVERGADIRIVQSLMRHSSIATTAKYLEVADQRRRGAIGLL